MSDSDGTPPASQAFGGRLRALRKARGLTLQEVAAECGLAVSTLSRVERGLMSPTYDKLVQLSQGLGVDMSELFGTAAASDRPQAQSGRLAITHLGQEYRVSTHNYDYRYLCSSLPGKQMDTSATLVKTRSLAEFGQLLRHSGEEFLFVLRGAVEVHVEGSEPILLQVGESVYFDATLGHAFLCAGEEPAEILVVNSGRR